MAGLPTQYTILTTNPTAYTKLTTNSTLWTTDDGNASYGSILQEDDYTILTEDGNNTIAQE